MGLRGYIASMRVLNSAMTGLGIVFAIVLYSEWSPPLHVLFIGFLTGFLGSAAAMLINDYVDRFVDKYNKPWKPIPRGEIDPRRVRDLSIVFLVLTIVLNTVLGLNALIVTTIYALISYTYSFLRKHWWSQLMVAFSTTSPIMYGYYAVNADPKYSLLAVFFSLTIFTASLNRELIKALMDMEGDKRYGYSTIPLRMGVEKTTYLIKALTITAPILAYLTGLLNNASTTYYALITITSTIYVYESIKTSQNPLDKEALEQARKKILYAMLIGLVAYLFTYTP